MDWRQKWKQVSHFASLDTPWPSAKQCELASEGNVRCLNQRPGNALQEAVHREADGQELCHAGQLSASLPLPVHCSTPVLSSDRKVVAWDGGIPG